MLWPSEIAQHGMLSFNLNQFLLSELGFPLLKIQRCHGIFILSLEFASCPVRITSKIPTYLLTYLLATVLGSDSWFIQLQFPDRLPTQNGMWHEPQLHPDFIVFSWACDMNLSCTLTSLCFHDVFRCGVTIAVDKTLYQELTSPSFSCTEMKYKIIFRPDNVSFFSFFLSSSLFYCSDPGYALLQGVATVVIRISWFCIS